ncbi:MAG: hypothetical protein ACREAY_07610 [Nitrososphaera sp.]|uniref:hypothetical protein n=1 Tax=Nitrososphaera sp. TaxID=1971748 RepID=UPI003D6F04AD
MNFGKVQKRRGIGTVITTLIVLIASVVLGAGVIFFGGSLFQTNTEQEAIQVSNSHLWVNSTASQGAFVVKNIGGKVVSVSSVDVRGTTVPFTSWYYNNTQSIMTAQNIQTPLNFDLQGLNSININGVNRSFTPATGPISLKQGEVAIIYVNNPAGISSTDSGVAYNMNVKAGQTSAVQSVSVING